MKSYLLALALMFIAGCNVEPSTFPPEETAQFVQSITYTKDPHTGLCFGMVVVRKVGRVPNAGLGLTTVPCEAVEKFLVTGK